MSIARTTLLLILSLLPVSCLAAQAPDITAIRAVMDRQVADWNRGDLDAFATGYKNAPDILFMGPTISRGYAQMLANYHRHYATKAKMGTLHFSQFEVQPLDEHFATATGRYHLDLAPEEGSSADGFFLFVFEKTPQGWKIIRDDTTTLPKAR